MNDLTRFQAKIESHLTGSAAHCALTVAACVPSTNTALKIAAEQGAPAPQALLARAQTQGRGRLGRSFFSPDATGIYCSILLRPALDAREALFLTTAAATAAAQAIEAITQKSVGIKWVNDLFYSGKKVCGILTEAQTTPDGALRYAVVGIGINLCLPKDGFPPELAAIATALYESADEMPEGIAERLCAELLNRFFAIYDTLPDHSFLEEYRRRSTVLGRRVRYLQAERSLLATAVAIDEEARIVLALPDGTEQAFDCGEISLRPESDAP